MPSMSYHCHHHLQRLNPENDAFFQDPTTRRLPPSDKPAIHPPTSAPMCNHICGKVESTSTCHTCGGNEGIASRNCSLAPGGDGQMKKIRTQKTNPSICRSEEIIQCWFNGPCGYLYLVFLLLRRRSQPPSAMLRRNGASNDL